MNAQASFTLRGRNPDVLTCIANLSNDEVFTPPEFANRMLDTLAEAWKSDHGSASQKTLDRGKELDPPVHTFILTKSTAPIYHLFVEQDKRLEPHYLSLVIPARWFAGGKGLDEFRETMLADTRLRSTDDYLSAADVFPGIGLKGSVCYFLWERDNPGLCRVTTHFTDWPVSTAMPPLLERGADVLIHFNEGLSILKKVVLTESRPSWTLSLPEHKRFDRSSVRENLSHLRRLSKARTQCAGDILVSQNG